MSYFFYTFHFCLIYFLTSLQINFALASENASSISESKSTSYGDKEDPIYLITGGYRPAQHTLAKYVVSIRKKSGLRSKYFGSAHFCGGSILNPQLILTAAHCLQEKGRTYHPSELEVVTSTPMRLVRTTHTQIIEVSKVIVHRKYYKRKHINDIGLLQLKSKIDLDDIYAQAIALPRAPPVVGATCVTLGWGRVFKGGPFVNEIVYVNLMLVAESICDRVFRWFTYGEICAFDPNNYERDSCQGDSGGPLLCNGSVAGIVSYGHGCASGKPAVYTDVYAYLDWIPRAKKIDWISSSKQRPSLSLLLSLSLTWTIIFS